MSSIWVVYRKELLETLRDRRTLVVMILLPLALYPLLGIGVSEWVTVQQTAQRAQTSRVGLWGESWPELQQALVKHGRLQVSRLAGDPSLQVRKGRVDVALRVPVGHRRSLEAGRTLKVALIYDETNDDSKLARGRVAKAIDKLATALLQQRLSRRALPAGFPRPLELANYSIATSEEVGGNLLGSILPMLVILMVLLGAFYPAIDLTAGEKERGTLETLLSTPASRLTLVTGKCLAVATIAAITGLLNLGSLGLTFALGFQPALEKAGVITALPWGAIAMTAVAVVPAALFFAALMVAIAALARSFKEAQTLLTPVYLVCILPAVLVQLPGVELNIWTALLPAVNVALLTGELIGGRLPLVPTVIAVVTTCCYAVLALHVAARIYNSERLLFAAERRRVSKSRTKPVRAEYPQPAQAAGLLLAVMAAVILLGRQLQGRSLISGVLATEWLLIALPVGLLIWRANLSARAVLWLRPPSAKALLGGLLCGVSGWYLVGVVVESLQQRVIPMPPELAEQARRLLFAGDRPLLLDLVALALSPAICEELLFRGVLLRSSVAPPKTASVAGAVVVNGLLFGLFHLSIYRLLPTTLLGLALAFITLRSRSIYPAMLFHLLNNALTLVLGRMAGPKGEVDLPWFVGLVAITVFAVGLFLASRKESDPARSAP